MMAPSSAAALLPVRSATAGGSARQRRRVARPGGRRSPGHPGWCGCAWGCGWVRRSTSPWNSAVVSRWPLDSSDLPTRLRGAASACPSNLAWLNWSGSATLWACALGSLALVPLEEPRRAPHPEPPRRLAVQVSSDGALGSWEWPRIHRSGLWSFSKRSESRFDAWRRPTYHWAMAVHRSALAQAHSVCGWGSGPLATGSAPHGKVTWVTRADPRAERWLPCASWVAPAPEVIPQDQHAPSTPWWRSVAAHIPPRAPRPPGGRKDSRASRAPQCSLTSLWDPALPPSSVLVL